MNELHVPRRSLSPACNEMLNQAPAPSSCVSPRPDTLTNLVAVRPRRPEVRQCNAFWNTLAPPRRCPAFNFLGSRLWRQTTCSVTGGNNKTHSPRFQQQQQQTPTIHRTTSRVDRVQTIHRQPGPRPSPPPASRTPPRQVRCGGASSFGSTPPYLGPEIPPSALRACAPPSGIAWPEGGGCPVGLGGGVRVDGPRLWSRRG